MSNLHMVNTQDFKYNKLDRLFYSNISELGCRGIDNNSARFFQKMERGVGFILVVNGRKVPMRLVKTNKIPSDWDANDWDVTSWIFEPVDFRHDFKVKLVVD